MKITIESTDRIVFIEQGLASIPAGSTAIALAGGTFTTARVWEGKTDSGIQVICLVTRIAAPTTEDLSEFARELEELKSPSIAAMNVWPLRLIL